MEKYAVGSKILKKEQVLISIFLISILVLSSGSMVAFARNNTYVVKPNGTDDTADIQAAFNACGSTPGCTVQLVAGTYYVGQIAVFGFQGRFVGMGQGVTIIQALPNLPSPNPLYDTDTVPFWAALPTGASGSNPWPVLFTFMNGAFSISGMTISEPYSTPTVGWDLLGYSTTALYATILITGEQQASGMVDHVTFIGAAGDFSGFNIVNAMTYGGQLLPPSWSDPFADIIPLAGTFSITNSVFTNVQTGPYMEFLTNSNVVVSGNTFAVPIASASAQAIDIDVLDISSTHVVVSGNHGTAPYGAAIYASQGIYKSSLSPSTLLITDNNFQLYEAAGAFMYDVGTTPSLSAVVSGNVFPYTGAVCSECPLIQSAFLKSFVVSGNTMESPENTIGIGVFVATQPLSGPGTVSGNTIRGADEGVLLGCDFPDIDCLYPADGVHVTGNVITNSAQYGIALVSGSSNNYITGNFVHNSVVDDLYWDGSGTNNHWCGNIYTTSSPSVLPSC